MSHDKEEFGAKMNQKIKRIYYEDRTQNTKKKKTQKKNTKEKFTGLHKFWNLFGNSASTFAIIYKF